MLFGKLSSRRHKYAHPSQGKATEVMLDKLNGLGAARVSRRKRVMVLSNNPFTKGVDIRDIDSIKPANNSICAGPTVLVLVLFEGTVEEGFMVLDFREEGVRVVFDLVSTDVFRFQKGYIGIVVIAFVIVGSSRESVCADHC